MWWCRDDAIVSTPIVYNRAARNLDVKIRRCKRKIRGLKARLFVIRIKRAVYGGFYSAFYLSKQEEIKGQIEFQKERLNQLTKQT